MPRKKTAKKSSPKTTIRRAGASTTKKASKKTTTSTKASKTTKKTAAKRTNTTTKSIKHTKKSSRARKQSTPDKYLDNKRGIRLQKALADAGVASRRDCETLIEQGDVTVNGTHILSLPAWVDPVKDCIEVRGKSIYKPELTTKVGKTTRKYYVMVNKPKRVISTNEDPEGRRRVIDLVDIPGDPRLFPVGRLDADSQGLILLTNDGELANRLTHPRYEVVKHYQVKIKGRLKEADVTVLKKGIYLAHSPTSSAKPSAKPKRASALSVKILGTETDRIRGDKTTLAITLAEGQNREIRRLLASLGFKVRKLTRVGIGPLRLKGVPTGSWRMLTTQEVAALKKATKLKK
ncbi:pseudouridine synthase [Poriferisphaera sp. WC338]|uniref:pseudouridine synthase n=1 Tax=Poriferisphaera sp. WC338 TaxID=3425129 RepID=UPI003D8166DA